MKEQDKSISQLMVEKVIQGERLQILFTLFLAERNLAGEWEEFMAEKAANFTPNGGKPS